MTKTYSELIRSTGAGFRSFVGAVAIFDWCVGFLHGASRPIEVLLMLLGLCLLVDIAINEIMPDRFKWRLALRQRHFILLGMAFCNVVQIFAASTGHHATPAYYLINTVVLVFVALIDANQRSKESK